MHFLQVSFGLVVVLFLVIVVSLQVGLLPCGAETVGGRYGVGLEDTVTFVVRDVFHHVLYPFRALPPEGKVIGGVRGGDLGIKRLPFKYYGI